MEYVKLGLLALCPVLATVIFEILLKKTKFGNWKFIWQQIIIGVVFGGLAVLGTECGVPINGAQMNCRDAAVITAGMLFGWPAGIIAGVIGGVERYVAVAWGIGTYTQIACSVSTVIAGIYGGILRKFLFKDKRPNVIIALFCGIVMEVFHMNMVFLTHAEDSATALGVVRNCTLPLVIANSASVFLSTLAVNTLPYWKKKRQEKALGKKSKIALPRLLQRWLLLTIVLAFAVSSVFIYEMQDKIAKRSRDELVGNAIEEVEADLEDASDSLILSRAEEVKREISDAGRAQFDLSKVDLAEIAEKFGLCEVHLINNSGKIINSNVSQYIGFNMNSGEQSKAFMVLTTFGGPLYLVQEFGTISYGEKTGEEIKRKYAGIRLDDGNGFLQIAYNGQQLLDKLGLLVVDLSKNTRVGENGFAVILDGTNMASGKLVPVSKPTNVDLTGLTADFLKNQPNTTFSISLGKDATPYYAQYKQREGYYIVSFLPESEALQMRDLAVYLNSYMEIIMFAVLFFLVYLLIEKVVVERIDKVNGSLAKITGGDLDEVVDVRITSEFDSLSSDINSTVDSLKGYIAEAEARIDKELQLAKNIQSSILPRNYEAFAKREEFDIFAYMDTAKEVGGDFYDFYLTRKNVLNFLIADVSGKGIPAAMFMMHSKTVLKGLTEQDLALSNVFEHANNELCDGNNAGMFVTAWQGRIDLRSGVLQYVNAGHNPPLIKKKNGRFEYLKMRAGFVLAGMEGVNYRLQEMQLEPGDTVFLYTDGVTEATNAENHLYGEERLFGVLNSMPFDSMQELCEFVKADVDAFVGDAPQFDDITMVAFRYNGEYEGVVKEFDAKTEELPNVIAFLEEEMEKAGCSMKAMMQLDIAVEEVFVNIAHYAFPHGDGKMTFQIKVEGNKASFRFIDDGLIFNPLKKQDPDITKSAEERDIGGLGIYMVKQSMDEVTYENLEGKNILTIVKTIK